MKRLKKLGALSAFFLADLSMRPREEVFTRWLSVIGRLRGTDEQRDTMKHALSTTSAQNLTKQKVDQVLDQVRRHLEEGEAITDNADEDDEEEVEIAPVPAKKMKAAKQSRAKKVSV
jgi:hypothetical protein